MHNRFIKVLFAFTLFVTSTAGFGSPPVRDYYAIRIYRFADKHQEEDIDNFLKAVYLPALHRAGISKVGVFKPVETDTAGFGKRIYLFIPLSSLKEYADLDGKLEKDTQLQTSQSGYWSASYKAPAYTRTETILLRSFTDMPHFEVPVLKGGHSERIYELRSYEGPSEKIFANKVQMFNQGGEVILFKKLGFNAVFYSEVISGSHMPNLMYMTSFDDMKSHDEHWKSFVDDPEWKRISTLPEYQHNVSHIDIYLLHPAEYSEI